MNRIVDRRYIKYIGVKYIWYDGDLLRPADSDKLVHCVYGNGAVVYYDPGVQVRYILPNGEEVT